MSRKRSSARETKKRGHTRWRWPRLGSLVAGGIVVAAAGSMVVLIVYGLAGNSDSDPKDTGFEPAITETRSESHGAGPFEGGARLHFPVDEMDFGYVPLNTNVSYAFAMTNVGDATIEIEDVSVEILEGC